MVVVDSNNMMLIRGDEESWKDSVGRTALGFIAYGDKKFFKAVNKCSNKMVRHPDHPPGDISRDHVNYMFIMWQYMWQYGLDWCLSLTARANVYKMRNKLKWKLSEDHNMTIDMWLWIQALCHKHVTLFYVVCIILHLLNLWWNNVCWILGWFSLEEDQNTYISVEPSRWKKFISKKMYPMYSLHNFAWQLYVMDSHPLRWVLQKICLLNTGRYNYLVKLLLGGKVTQEQVDNYKEMTNYRWGVYLNDGNIRWTYILEMPGEYPLETDLLKKIYDERNN